MGDALVFYDPGLSGATTRMAEKVTVNLIQRYTVILAGVKNSAATIRLATWGTVAGSAIYTGAPTSSIKEFLSGLNLAAGTKIGSFWQLAKLNHIGRCSNES